MKIPKLPVRKKVRASTARRSMAPSDEMDYEEMSEPNMKLSRALLVVLVLHVVAVAGIIAFNTIKSRQGVLPTVTSTSTSPAVSASPVRSDPASAPPNDATAAAPATAANQAPLPRREEADAAPAPVKATAKDEPVKAAKALPVEDSGKIYIVAKGDNPVNIARKLKVSQAELLSLNNITDPTKLQIGQKLIVPAKTTASAKSTSSSKSTTTAKASKTKKSDD